jgi:TnpA family transposase
MRNPVEMARTIYPRLADIPDEETLSAITTLETQEREFIDTASNERSRYLSALYLKAMAYLGHARFLPGGLPRLVRLRIATETGLAKEFANILKIHPVEKSRIVSVVRKFIGLRPYRRRHRLTVEGYLQAGIAREEGHLLPVVNAATEWFRDQRVELPAFGVLMAMAEHALGRADHQIQNSFLEALGSETVIRLDNLLVEEDGRSTLFSQFKSDSCAPSPVNFKLELQRLRELRRHLASIDKIKGVPRRKIERFAQIGQRYTAAEVRQLKTSYRATVLSCYLISRYAQLLDTAAEMFIQVWKKARADATKHANEYRDRRNQIREQHEAVFSGLLDVICTTVSEADLARGIFTYRTPEEYERLRTEVKEGLSWNECFYRKLQDHYGALRLFLPEWYEEVPLVATTAHDALIKGLDFIKAHLDPKSTTLPVAGVPTAFLSSEWMRRAIVRQRWSDQISVVRKANYELGAVEATANSLEEGIVAIKGAGRYAPMTQHLIDRDEYLANYRQHLAKLDLPETAAGFYTPHRDNTGRRLQEFDKNYDEVKSICRINRKGTLSYLQQPSYKPPRRIEKLVDRLQPYMMPITVFDLLLDCHRLTGFLDAFRPLGGRQNMSEHERLMNAMATIYAYANNYGPTQAGQATGIRKQAIVYFRRHYMGVRRLMEAASVLVDAYSRTALSGHLRNPGVFMTDSMRFPTLENSLTAREHFRYPGGKHVLLYQHVTTDCICFFSKALLCDVSEGIYMIHGAVKQQSNFDPSINICDNAGRSDFTDGMALLLNIEVLARLSSRQNLKLWRVDDTVYTNIDHGFGGEIRFEYMDTGWLDMIWILASIASGKADPSIIAEILRTQPNHPATRGFHELGKLNRTGYMVRFGTNMNLRRFVMRHTARRETWNQFGRSLYNSRGGMVREKSQEGQDELFWFLTVMQNAIVLWNAMALEQAISRAKSDGVKIDDDDLQHILPTMIEHINFIGTFDINMNRKTPFKLAV